MLDFKIISPGDIVQHRINKEWVMVLYFKYAHLETFDKKEAAPDRIACRTKSFDVIQFYPFELEPIKKKNGIKAGINNGL